MGFRSGLVLCQGKQLTATSVDNGQMYQQQSDLNDNCKQCQRQKKDKTSPKQQQQKLIKFSMPQQQQQLGKFHQHYQQQSYQFTPTTGSGQQSSRTDRLGM